MASSSSPPSPLDAISLVQLSAQHGPGQAYAGGSNLYPGSAGGGGAGQLYRGPGSAGGSPEIVSREQPRQLPISLGVSEPSDLYERHRL